MSNNFLKRIEFENRGTTVLADVSISVFSDKVMQSKVSPGNWMNIQRWMCVYLSYKIMESGTMSFGQLNFKAKHETNR